MAVKIAGARSKGPAAPSAQRLIRRLIQREDMGPPRNKRQARRTPGQFQAMLSRW